MGQVRFGNVIVVPGQHGGRFPFCNSLLIDDSAKVIVDPGAGLEPLAQVREQTAIDVVFNTHFHFDHIIWNYLFDLSKVYLNDIEAGCYRDRGEIALRLGMEEFYGEPWTGGWLERISRRDAPQSPYTPQNRHEWWLSTARLGGTYRWGDVMNFVSTKMEIIGTPGHSAGFCCLHFPNEAVVYTGDIDLTPFGPWYFGADGDIDLFIESARRIARLDADVFVTGHEAGIVGGEEFRRRLGTFLETIDRRDERILDALSEPRTYNDLCAMGLIYGQKFLVDDWLRAWDALAVKKHLERLIAKGVVTCRNGLFLLIQFPTGS